jgi:hypothetical protein
LLARREAQAQNQHHNDAHRLTKSCPPEKSGKSGRVNPTRIVSFQLDRIISDVFLLSHHFFGKAFLHTRKRIALVQLPDGGRELDQMVRGTVVGFGRSRERGYCCAWAGGPVTLWDRHDDDKSGRHSKLSSENVCFFFFTRKS